jgi:hypothetical protein
MSIHLIPQLPIRSNLR